MPVVASSLGSSHQAKDRHAPRARIGLAPDRSEAVPITNVMHKTPVKRMDPMGGGPSMRSNLSEMTVA